MEGKRVVVTGGAGFIGSNLAEVLCPENEVTVIDNLSTGKKENLDGLDVKFIKGSITDLELLKKEFLGIDYVFHIGALPSVPRSIKEPEVVNEVNVTGTLNVLIAARDASVKKVAFASSSSVYGDTPILPKVETMPTSPLSPYAVTKLVGEHYLRVFYEVYGLPTVSVRYFNVYGPRQDPESTYAAVMPKFITALMQDKTPTIYGDGEQTRDFTFVKDTVRGTILACESEKTNGQVINVAGGRRISVNNLVESLNKIMGKEIKPNYVPPREGDVKHSLADISKARELAGYEPEYSIDKGLAEVVEYYKTLNA